MYARFYKFKVDFHMLDNFASYTKLIHVDVQCDFRIPEYLQKESGVFATKSNKIYY